MNQSHRHLLELRETLNKRLVGLISTRITLESWGDIPYIKITNLSGSEPRDVIEIFTSSLSSPDAITFTVVVDGDVHPNLPDEEVPNFILEL